MSIVDKILLKVYESLGKCIAKRAEVQAKKMETVLRENRMQQCEKDPLVLIDEFLGEV